MLQRLAVLTLTSSVMSLLQVSPLQVTVEQRVQHAVAVFEVLCQILLDTGVHLPTMVVSLQRSLSMIQAAHVNFVETGKLHFTK